jgi:AcrR family transcriptional regulator
VSSALTTQTPDLLLAVAERLFAEHGVDEVSLAQINREAGQRNRSAINYHFGSKQSLLLAILERHEEGLERERHRLLEELEHAGRVGVREVASALVEPLAAKLDDPEGGHAYLQIVSQLVGHPRLSLYERHLTVITARSDRVARLFAKARDAIGPELWTARSILVTGLLYHSLADYARLCRSDAPRVPVPPAEVFVSGLIDGITALIEAPVTGAKKRARGSRTSPRH